MISEENKKIWTLFNKEEEKILRKKVSDFDFSRYSKKEIEELIRFLRRMMVAHKGIGLAANQVGLDLRVFVAQLPSRKGQGGGYQGKFYAIFNPKIVSLSGKKIKEEEGCLSVPGFWGEVERAEKIEIEGFDKNQRPIRLKATGLLARIFQHEIDHLEGKLYIDKAKNLFSINQEEEEK
ncbi:MAG: peptide deformylase [Patescibacteria group bacterium]|nr:peptide deformylase [Patescibacteria group bacterium]